MARDREFVHTSQVGDYLVQGTKDEYAMVELTPEQRELFENQYDVTPLKRHLTTNGLSLGVSQAAVWGGAAIGLPTWAYASVVAGSVTGQIAANGYAPFRHSSDRRKRKRIEKSAETATGEGVMRFGKRDIKFTLPTSVLEEEVEFNAEYGAASVPASELFESMDRYFSGLHAREKTKGDEKSDKPATLEIEINPGQLVMGAMYDIDRESRGTFLANSQGPLQAIHKAQQKIPDSYANQFGSFEGLRTHHETASKELFLGALGLYGTVRAQAGAEIAERIRELYVDHGDHSILKDMLRLSSATTERLTWDDMVKARLYLSGLERLQRNE